MRLAESELPTINQGQELQDGRKKTHLECCGQTLAFVLNLEEVCWHLTGGPFCRQLNPQG